MSSEPDADIKQVLDDEGYEMVRKLGEGAFASVFLVRDKKKDEKVVCKSVRKEMVNKEWMTSYMVPEAKIPSTFRHPHIVQVLKAFKTERFMMTFLELVPGGELRDKMSKNERMTIDGKDYLVSKAAAIEINQLVTWFVHVASALKYINDKGYAHRDLKPENVLIDGIGNAKLADFGFLTRVRNKDGKLSSTLCGTLEYQAPEIGLGPYDASRADIWSLGQILYEMLFGRTAFKARDPAKCRQLKMQGRLDLKPDPLFRKEVHQLLMTLLVQMMEPDPVKRLDSTQVVRYIAQNLMVIF